MHISIFAIKEPDERWLGMKAIYDACIKAGVKVPNEVDDFFDNKPPDPAGVISNIGKHIAVSNWEDDVSEGFEVDVQKLDPSITRIRFRASY